MITNKAVIPSGKVGKILRKLCEWKDVNIVEAEVCPDYIHMLLEIPPKYSVSKFIGYLKGKSATLLYEQFGEQLTMGGDGPFKSNKKK